MTASGCLHPGRPDNARCDGCPFVDHASATDAIAARTREREPSLLEHTSPTHPCDAGCLLHAETATAR
jgi:hypothetical protein